MEAKLSFKLKTDMEEVKKEKPKTVYIKDFSITFYGGKTGIHENIRAIIALYDFNNKLVTWVKFYEEIEKIENDSFDVNNILNMNLPYSSYSNVTETLRSKRPIQILFFENNAMLLELKIDSIPKAEHFSNEKIN
ncbi:MAG: hypothetical protein ABI840_08900 [bacterium]